MRGKGKTSPANVSFWYKWVWLGLRDASTFGLAEGDAGLGFHNSVRSRGLSNHKSSRKRTSPHCCASWSSAAKLWHGCGGKWPMEMNKPDPGPRGSLEARAGRGGLLLFELINGLLLLIDLVPEPGQLPVMGLPVTLQLHLQGLLRRPPSHAQSQTPRHQMGEGPSCALPLPHSPSHHLHPGCPAPCPLGPLHAQFLRERRESSLLSTHLLWKELHFVTRVPGRTGDSDPVWTPEDVLG